MRWFIVIAFAVLLAGCMVGPDYVRPVVDVPAGFRYEDKDTKETANTEWWKQFQDPVLDALIAEALANNKNVKIAVANIERASGVLVQARSPLYPRSGTAAARQGIARARPEAYLCLRSYRIPRPPTRF